MNRTVALVLPLLRQDGVWLKTDCEWRWAVCGFRYKVLVYSSLAVVEPTAANCLVIVKNAELDDFEIGETKVGNELYAVLNSLLLPLVSREAV